MGRPREVAVAARSAARPRGRPTWYNVELDDQVYKLALLGQTDEEMAATIGVPVGTFNRWKANKRYFREAIARGKGAADGEVAAALFERAKGYSHKAVKIFAPKDDQSPPRIVEYTEHYPPDTPAASLWLRNRQPKHWREKTDIDLKADLTLEHLVLGAIEKRETPDLPPAITDDRRDED